MEFIFPSKSKNHFSYIANSVHEGHTLQHGRCEVGGEGEKEKKGNQPLPHILSFVNVHYVLITQEKQLTVLYVNAMFDFPLCCECV